MEFLRDYQLEAIKKMHNGCILNGGVGSGKSRTGLYYYFALNGGSIDDSGYRKMTHMQDLYIITTARKRDTKEWEGELCPYLLSPDPDICAYPIKVVVDSWNNIKKYTEIENSFFLFDEQRVVGYGTWTKSFLKITKKNEWILLSATPGDCWSDYMPVFVANGFFKNKSQFNYEHVVFDKYAKFPKIKGYLNEGRLIRLRNSILVNMDFERQTERHDIWIDCDYDEEKYKAVLKTRWNVYENKPVETAAELAYLVRKIVNSDETRLTKIFELLDRVGHDGKPDSKLIIFYNYDYELESLREIAQYYDCQVREWNGHKHEEIPINEDFWVYLVQYNAGCEGWNCISTDTIVFYSQNYSWKVMEQASGRIDRLTTPYKDLYYYHLTSKSPIDRAISAALTKKKIFNEVSYLKKGGYWNE